MTSLIDRANDMAGKRTTPEAKMIRELVDALGGSEAVSVPVAELLAIRDALIEGDLNDAYHHLYTIADPTFCEMEPWRNMEHKAALAASPPVSAKGEVTVKLSDLDLANDLIEAKFFKDRA